MRENREESCCFLKTSPTTTKKKKKKAEEEEEERKGVWMVCLRRVGYTMQNTSVGPRMSPTVLAFSETRPCCLTLQSLSPQDHDTRFRRMKAVIRSPQFKREKNTSPATKTSTNTARCFVSSTAVLSSLVMMM